MTANRGELKLACSILVWGCIFASIASSADNQPATDRESANTQSSVVVNFDAFETGSQSIEFEAIVVYVNATATILRVQDDQGRMLTCFADTTFEKQLRSLKLGNRVRLRTSTTTRKRVLQLQELDVTGQGDPIVQALRWHQNEPYTALGRYVEVPGIIQEICLKDDSANFILRADEGVLMVRMPRRTDDIQVESWLGKKVRVQGPMSKNYVHDNAFFGFRIDMMGDSQIELLETNSVSLAEQIAANGINVERFEGVVDGSDPSQHIFLNGVRIPTRYAFLAESGRRAKGYVVRSKTPDKLPYTFLRLEELTQQKPQKPIDASDVLGRVEFQRRATVDGIILEWHRKSFWSECYVKSNGMHFRAVVPTYEDSRLEDATDKLTVGSLVRFTGVLCKPNASRFASEAFLIRADRPSEMVLLKDSKAITRDRIVRRFSIGSGLLAAVLVWVLVLRRQVASRTKIIQHMSSLLKSASEAIPHGMMIFSSDQQLVASNEHARNELGEISNSKISQLDVSKVFQSTLGKGEAFSAFWNAAFQDPQLVAECEFKTLDGLGYRSFYTAPIPNEHGGFFGRIWTISDTTTLRMIEAERVHSQKIQAIGRLAGGVAHDFNNLLAAISANLSLAISPKIHEASRNEHIAIAQSVVQRASKLTKHLLGFSRQSTLEVTIVNVSDILDEVHGIMRHTFDPSVCFSMTIQSNLYSCRADATQLEQVIINLCVNARDALSNKNGMVSLYARNTTHAEIGDCVQITVEDDGIGMNEETQEKIFEPFFTTKDIGAGTGLGLSIALGVIDQLGGRIKCHSVLGHGTRFDVFLPRCECQSAPTPLHLPVTKPSIEFQPLNVLLVDDDPVLRDCGSLLLSVLGHQVVCAENGKEALEILATDATIHTVLLDLTMPIMSGSETLANIRTDFPNVRVVICSGYSVEAEMLTKNIKIRPDAILAKPYQVSDLQRVLSQNALVELT